VRGWGVCARVGWVGGGGGGVCLTFEGSDSNISSAAVPLSARKQACVWVLACAPSRTLGSSSVSHSGKVNTGVTGAAA
jgi:hypothetical protein